jgi:ATP-dependent helicase/nuclease subunit A
MHEPYLDPGMSIIISSPAGSGKTEKLARRYISLLDSGAPVEKILCITFTEKAAAEMKQRILSILGRERPEMLEALREKIPLMRISTIHAFCLKVLKRFSIELVLDPSLEVMDENEAKELWAESVQSSLISESSEPGLFFGALKDKGIRGWSSVRRILDDMHSRSPLPELMIEQRQDILDTLSQDASTILGLYSVCLANYSMKKRGLHLLDFNDIELLAHKALSLGPEAHNILYSFDEHTDHLLVDEFQDTSTLQWKIIDKLTEEWRSGLGAKRESGRSPTLFLVGDEKQSIYLFRGANVTVFRQAETKLDEWMGEDHRYIEVKDNFRSLKAITDFTNSTFSPIMHPEPEFDWASRYSPFEPSREGQGRVELLLFDGGDRTKGTREHEAGLIARRILSLAGSFEISAPDGKRPCRFEDMAILIRKRTHLGLLESALHRAGIPFVVQKGVGFYEEPEVAILREMVSFIADPRDDYAIFCLLRSPLFRFGYAELFSLSRKDCTLLESLQSSEAERHVDAANKLLELSATKGMMPLSVIMEQTLVDTEAWRFFSGPQRRANIKKFLSIIDEMQNAGLAELEIRERLIRQRGAHQVAKANINAEGMDAVRIMTVHASKGLQFPMVFLPAMDEPLTSSSGPVVFHETGDEIDFWFEDDYNKRRKLEPFRLQKLKEQEEQKRLFYVAVTRTMDFLCMTGAMHEGKAPAGRLAYLEDAFGIFSEGDMNTLPFEIVSEADFTQPSTTGKTHAFEHSLKQGIFTAPIEYGRKGIWVNAALGTDIDVHGHGSDWTITGTVLHDIFEELSLGITRPEDVLERSKTMLRGVLPSGRRKDDVVGRIAISMERLEASGLLDEVILQSSLENYTELPFVLDEGEFVYKGRIDRLIVKNDIAHVYDYKCFPVKKPEEASLAERYRHQMHRYTTAAENLFSGKAKAFLLLAYEGRLVEVFF